MRLLQRIKHHFVPSEHNAYRPHILHRPWLVFFFVVILATEGFLVSNLIARQSSQNFLAAVVPGEIIALTNVQRADNDAGTLTEDSLLDKAAQAKADDMAANGYFSHIGPDGKTPWQWIAGAGYQYQYAGENLAVRFIDSSEVVNAWMESPTHRANIVKKVYTAIGVGVAQGLYQGESATFVVQYFGTPESAALASASAPTQTQAVATAAPASTPAPKKTTTVKTTPVKTTPAVAEAPAEPTPTVVVSEPVDTTAAPQVEGASVAAAPATLAANNFVSYMQSFLKQLMRAFAEPLSVSNWILGLCATILIIALALTFFMHIHIQPGQMLMSGAFVALFALSLIGINSRLTMGAGPGGNSLAASPAEAGGSVGVVLTDEAASTGYALFPGQ